VNKSGWPENISDQQFIGPWQRRDYSGLEIQEDKGPRKQWQTQPATSPNSGTDEKK